MQICRNLSMIVGVVAGGLLGYLAASFEMPAATQANAAVVSEGTSSVPGLMAASSPPIQPAVPPCCSKDLTGGRLMAMSQLQDKAKTSPSGKQPNIVVIMGDDVGIWNIGAYHRGMMAGRTPHLDRLAAEGMLFTDYYAEASCTAGRANFITGQLPKRTGMTTVGQAGASIGLPAQAPTIATALKSMGYATGQFGKNHLGDRNEFLPTVHGFDEFFGYP